MSGQSPGLGSGEGPSISAPRPTTASNAVESREDEDGADHGSDNNLLAEDPLDEHSARPPYIKPDMLIHS